MTRLTCLPSCFQAYASLQVFAWARAPCICGRLLSSTVFSCNIKCMHVVADSSLRAQSLAHLCAATATPFVLVVTAVLEESPKAKVRGWPPTTIVESSVSVARNVNVWSVLALVGSTVAARLVASSTATLHPRQRAEH